MNKILAKFAIVGMVVLGVINVADGYILYFEKGISCSGAEYNQHDVDFTVVCNSSNQGRVVIRGSSVCNDQEGVRPWNALWAQTDSTGKNCWCKVIRPVVSTWYLAYTGSDVLDCADNCTAKCAELVKGSAFWTKAYEDGLKI